MKFCPECGHAFPETKTWPKTCPACNHQEWANPKPVAIALCAFAGGLLLIRRNTGLADHGKWAMPGGYVEPFEVPEVTAARELREETEYRDPATRALIHPGVELPSDVFEDFKTIGRGPRNQVLLFYLAQGPRIEEAIERWWRESETHRQAHPVDAPWNTEALAVDRYDPAEPTRLEIAFETHQQMIDCWLARRAV